MSPRKLGMFRFVSAFLTFCVFLNGCSSTVVPLPPKDPSIDRLVAANRRSLDVTIVDRSGAFESERVGFQYVVGFIPFGSVRLERPISTVCTIVENVLAFRGYRSVCNQDSSSSPFKLTLEITDISLNGCDFLFIRKPVADVTIRATLRNQQNDIVRFSESEESASEYTRFAFQDDLSRVLAEGFKKTLEKVTLELGL